MKKSVTIPKVDEELYNQIKEKAAERNTPISELVENLFQNYIEGNSSVEANEYKAKLEQAAAAYQEVVESYTNIKNQNADLHTEIAALKAEIEKLNENNGFLFERNQELNQQKEVLLTSIQDSELPQNAVLVEFDDLEYALIEYIAEKECQRTAKNLTPADLLKAMFINYSVKGEMWFFKQPTRSEINRIKESLKAKNDE